MKVVSWNADFLVLFLQHKANSFIFVRKWNFLFFFTPSPIHGSCRGISTIVVLNVWRWPAVPQKLRFHCFQLFCYPWRNSFFFVVAVWSVLRTKRTILVSFCGPGVKYVLSIHTQAMRYLQRYRLTNEIGRNRTLLFGQKVNGRCL